MARPESVAQHAPAALMYHAVPQETEARQAQAPPDENNTNDKETITS
jgi:hypothetical protein